MHFGSLVRAPMTGGSIMSFVLSFVTGGLPPDGSSPAWCSCSRAGVAGVRSLIVQAGASSELEGSNTILSRWRTWFCEASCRQAGSQARRTHMAAQHGTPW